MILWILGSGGLLGSHIKRASKTQGEIRLFSSSAASYHWNNAAELTKEFNTDAEALAQECEKNKQPWAIVWAAGTATVHTNKEALDEQTQLLSLLLEAIQAHLAHLKGCIFFASSVAVYGNTPEQELTEKSSCKPVSTYGVCKLEQEALLAKTAAIMPHMHAIAGRISTLYGPLQDQTKKQGLIAHISHSIINRTHVHIVVPLDTARDYLHASDAATQILESIQKQLLQKHTMSLTTKLIVSGTITTIAQIIGVFTHLTRHRPIILAGKKEQSSIHQRTVRFRSVAEPTLTHQQQIQLPEGIAAVHRQQFMRHRKGVH